MSDRPSRSNDNTPDEQSDQQPDNSTETQAAPYVDAASSGDSGWQAPSSSWRQPGAETWRRPQTGTTASAEVPALPREMEDQPSTTGGWHRPRPEDTPFSDSDQLVVTTEGEENASDTAPATGEQADDAQSEAVQPAAADNAQATTSEASAPEDQAEQTAETATGATASAAPVPQAPEDMMSMLDAIEDEPDEDLFSMSELIALASLVDEEPRAEVRPSDAAPSVTTVMPAEGEAVSDEDSGDISLDALTPAQRAVMQQQAATPSSDPAEYARQQLAALGGTAPTDAPAAPAASEETAQEQSAGDASEYARQQVAALNNAIPPGIGETTTPPSSTGAAPAAPAMDPREEELARRFSETEEEVQTLRQMLNAGQISQDQFEDQLRSLMILDDDQVWWMLGAESDNWYKYQNNDWVSAEPPRLPSSDYYVNAPLPTLESQPIAPATSPTAYNQAEDIELDEYNMPVPRSGVPVVDPDRTIVGPSYLDPYLRNQDQTVQAYSETSQPTIASPPISDATIASAAVPVPYGSIESPIVSSQAPVLTDIEPYAPTYEEAAGAYRSNQVRNLVFAGLAALGIAFLIGVGAVLLILSWYNNIVEEYEPSIIGLVNYQPAFQTVTLLDYRDRPLATLSQAGEERIEVSLDQMSPYLIHAVVATQNSTFYNDPGWDFGSVVRAYLDNLSNNPVDDTDRTITQQVAQALVVQDTTDTPQSRLDSLVVAGELTRRYDKNMILALFLNESSFGNQAYGVEAASQFYFGISAEELSIAQAAMLAGILQDPVAYDPVTNREAALAQMNDVLLRMGQVGCLDFQHGEWAAANQEFCVTPDEVDSPQTAVAKARVIATRFRPRQDDLEYPHFVTLVRQQLETAFGPNQLYSSGYTVRTTLVPELQDYAQDRLEDQLVALSASGVSQGAILMTEPTTGAIRVYIGSEDFYNSENQGEIDYARTYQQPGAAIQPMIYAAAFDGLDRNGDGTLTNDEYLTPASIIFDVPTTYDLNPPFIPVNVGNQFYGPVAARIALAGNYNVWAVKALDFIGIDEFIATSRAMGLRWEENAAFGLPSALGDPGVRLYDMMVAYGTIATGGSRVPLYAIENIRDRQGNDVPLPESLRPPTQPEVLSNSVSFLLQNLLSDNPARVASGVFPENNPLNIANLGRQGWAAAKTGTSEANRDLWTVGFVSNAAVGVWLGRPDDGPINTLSGLTAAAPLWNEVLTQTVNSNTRSRPVQFAQPNTVNVVPICPDTGVQQGGTCASPIRNEYFAVNRQPPPATQGLVGQVEVNSWTGLLVTDACAQPEDRVTITYIDIADPSAVAWLNTSEGQAYAQRIGLPANIVPRPTAGCDVNTVLPTANIVLPTTNQTVQGPIDITGQVSAPNFNRYSLEYAPINTQNWTQITTSTVPQGLPNSVLGNWDTSGIANGQYVLRLGVFSNEGGYIYRSVPIVINNPTPTPTLTPTQTPPPTATDFIIPTIPFDPINPTAALVPTLDVGFATLPPLPFDDTGGPTPTVNTSGN